MNRHTHLRVLGEADAPVGPGGFGVLDPFAEEGAVVGGRVRSGGLAAPALSLLGVARQLLVRLALALPALLALLGCRPLRLLSLHRNPSRWPWWDFIARVHLARLALLRASFLCASRSRSPRSMRSLAAARSASCHCTGTA